MSMELGPYTNFHELNLDWFLNEFNKVLEEWEDMQKSFSDLNAAFSDLRNYVYDYFKNLDVQEEIDKKLDDMANDGSLYAIIRKYTDPIVNEQNSKIIVLENRMNTFTSLPEGSTSGDAELIDIRIPAAGFNGNNPYHSAGDAVRGQASELKGDIDTLENGNADNNVVVYTRHTGGENDYTINFKNEKNYVYEVIVTNESETAGYFSLKRYNGEQFSGSETETKLLANGESISILIPYDIQSQIVVVNQNNDKKGILIKKRSNKNIDFKNILYRYQFVKNTYLNDAKPEAFPSSVIRANGWNRFITIYNNSDNDGHFGIKVQNNSNSDVYSVSSENYPLIKAKSSYTFNIGNNEVRYIFVENPDVIDDFTLLLYENVHREKVYCGENRKYTKFIDALDYCNATGNCDLFVDAGVYDLISEIGESNMPAYITPNTSGHGCFIGNDTRLYMSSGAVIKCLYTGSNETVNKDFAIFNVSNKTGFGDFEIHGGRFESSGIRYTVHDEAQGVSEYRHAYYDCNMKNDNTESSNPVWHAKQCIGGGLGQHGTVLIDGGIYNSVGIDSDTDKGTITYHNPDTGTSSTFKNNVTIKNVYCETGTCYVSCLGDDTTEDATVFIATNNNVKGLEPFANGLDNPNVNHNVTIKSWNNKIRS